MKYSDINNDFKLPIYYIDKKESIDDNIIIDLELNEFNIKNDIKEHQDLSNNKSKLEINNLKKMDNLYNNIIKPNTLLGKNLLQQWPEYISYDKDFLLDNQKIYSEVKVSNYTDIDGLFTEWYNIKNHPDFLYKYNFLEWEILKPINKNSFVMQCLSIYSLISPIMSLCLPIILCIIPYFILKATNKNITFESYYSILKTTLTRIPIGKLLHLKNMSLGSQLYTVITSLFYIYQIYQNSVWCYKFYLDQFKITNYFEKLKDFSLFTINEIDKYLKVSIKCQRHNIINNKIIQHKLDLQKFINDINTIQHFKLNVSSLSNIGYTMVEYYKLYNDIDKKELLCYSFGLNAYFEHITLIQCKINNKTINKCKFKKKHTKFVKSFNPILNKQDAIKNTVSIKKNKLITGPNAAGKTTLLKSILFNIIFSQQIGFGFYKSGNVKLYRYLHCYINIPDTSGRDSLFQAEARRCKEILTLIENNKENNHFCIFDELYSGTNPIEAVATSYSYLKYINEFKNVNFTITTHYYDLCKKLKDDVDNNHMEIIKDNDNIKYTYKIKKGMSEIKGGVSVLKNLNFPIKLINNIKNNI